jgi:predicted Zn-dependent protease
MKFLRFGLFALIAALATACATNPATGKRQLSFMSEDQEIQMGRELDAQVRQEMGIYQDEALGKYVEDIGMRLARLSPRPNLPWHFTIIDSPAVNAFALPGGYIYITRGIVAAMNSEAQLAGVIGHEIGHVTARHTAQQITRSQIAGVGLLAGMILSSDVARYGELAQQSLGLLFLKFSRDDETQADELGIRYCTKAGYDPREIPPTYDMLGRLALREGGGLPSWMSTHPDPGDRKVRRPPCPTRPSSCTGRPGWSSTRFPSSSGWRGWSMATTPATATWWTITSTTRRWASR